LARGRPGKGLTRFERIALVLSGCQALGAYQAGACAALERSGIRPNWISASGIGAVNAAIIAGNLPHQRIAHLHRFWQQLSRHAARRGAWGRSWWAGVAAGFGGGGADPLRPPSRRSPRPVIAAADLRELITEAVDFDRLNSGVVRVVMGALDLAAGVETVFDNDRHLLTLDHIMAGAPVAGLPAVTIGGRRFGGGAASVSALDQARPADTLCFVIDGYDPVPDAPGGISRSGREIAALRRTHDLRRMIGLLGERVAPALRREPDIRRCLAEASYVTMTILHLVHEDSSAGLAAKMANYSAAALGARWDAGEGDVLASLAHPRSLAPPPRLSGVVVHEVRGGVVAPQR
jgi:NTE family protein